MTTKLTNVKAIEYVISNCELPTDVAEKLEKIKISFEKKSSGERKPSAKQIENEGFKADIIKFMAQDTLYTVSELMKEVPTLAEVGASNQKVSALLKQLVDCGLVEKIVDKRKSYFKAKKVG